MDGVRSQEDADEAVGGTARAHLLVRVCSLSTFALMLARSLARCETGLRDLSPDFPNPRQPASVSSRSTRVCRKQVLLHLTSPAVVACTRLFAVCSINSFEEMEKKRKTRRKEKEREGKRRKEKEEKEREGREGREGKKIK